MTQSLRFLKVLICCFVSLTVTGCVATIPRNFLKLSEDVPQKRHLQSRQYDITDRPEEIISASAGVLQDLGFILEESETELGLVVASKKCDATDAGQVMGAFVIDLIYALGGAKSNTSETIDDIQRIKASVVCKPSLENDSMLVRVTFQRIVWNKRGDVSRMETMNAPELYQEFFERLSKSVFLEAQQI